MHVTQVELDNVRSFRTGDLKVSLDLTRPSGSSAGWTVVAGRNGAGKSTFLQAVALSIAGPYVSRSLQDSFAGWIRRGEEEACVRTYLEFDESRDRFAKTGRLPSTGFWTGLRWERTEGSEPSLTGYTPSDLQAPERGPWGDAPRGWFVAGYGPFRRLTGHASDALRLMVGPDHRRRLVTLFREDASLLECVQWLKDLRLRSLENKPGAEALETAARRLLNDKMLPGEVSIERVDSDGLWVRQADVVLPLEEMSDGYRTMIALVLDLMRHMHECYGSLPLRESPHGHLYVNLPGIVLIDEIDVHLHVSWQQRVGFWLKQRFPRVQFIVSTHSPYICQAADPGGLIRLPAPGENRTAEHVPSDLHLSIVRGTADDAALTDLFGLESTRSEPTRELLRELAELEARVVAGEATRSEKDRMKKLQLELPFTPSQGVERALEELSDKLAD